MAGRKKIVIKDKEPKKKELVRCGNCIKVEKVMSPKHLLSVKGEPILGKCEHWTASRCCLLSWPHYCDYYDDGTKPKTE